MDPREIADAVCNEADDFLAGVASRAEAKAGISEWITINHPGLGAPERAQVIERAMRILDGEGFFDALAGRESDEPPGFDAPDAADD